MTSLSPSSPYYSSAVDAASQYGVPQNLFLAQLGAESSGNPGAYNSSSGATGIAQFLPSTAANPGYGIAPFDPTDPYASIDAAAQYDAALFSNTGSWSGAMSAYSGTSAGNTPYAGNAGVQAELAAFDTASTAGGGGTSWSQFFANPFSTNIPGTGPGTAIGGQGSNVWGSSNPLSTMIGNYTSSGPSNSISIIDAGKRVGLFVVAVVLIGAGVWALAKGDVGERIDGAVKGLGRRLAS